MGDAPIFQVIEIEINRGCNLSCSYCPNHLHTVTHQDMSDELFLTLLKQLQSINYCGEIVFEFFNEPLLSPNLERFSRLTKEMLPLTYLYLYTNGTLLDYPAFSKLVEAGVDKFIVTKHEGLADYPFETILFQLNEDERKRVDFQHHDQLDKTSRGGILPHVGTARLPTLMPCYIPSFLTVITLEGDVLSCFEDYYKQNIMGNIMHQDILQIWNSPAYQKIRHDLRLCLRHKYQPCRSCNRQTILPSKHLIRKID